MLGNIFHQTGKNGESTKFFDNALKLLTHYESNDILPRSDGLTAGHLKEMIYLLTNQEIPA